MDTIPPSPTPSHSELLYNTTLSLQQIQNLTPDELIAYRNSSQQRFAIEHAGHDQTHRQMAIVAPLALVFSQLVLLFWREKHPKNFQFVSCIGLWIIPFILAVREHFWRFVTIWVIYSCVNSYVIRRASKRPLDQLTPAIVYKWYSVIYQVCYGVGTFGYVIFMATLLGITGIFYTGSEPLQLGLILLFYGTYFGVLSRDFVEVCSDRMAASMGYYSKEGFPKRHLRANICAVCGGNVQHDPAKTTDHEHGEQEAETFELPCKHVFHRNCIKGWCLIGKKEVCPYCKERFDRKQFSRNPWDTQQEVYLRLLDGVRYLLVWQPVIFGTLKLFFYMTGME